MKCSPRWLTRISQKNTANFIENSLKSVQITNTSL